MNYLFKPRGTHLCCRERLSGTISAGYYQALLDSGLQLLSFPCSDPRQPTSQFSFPVLSYSSALLAARFHGRLPSVALYSLLVGCLAGTDVSEALVVVIQSRRRVFSISQPDATNRVLDNRKTIGCISSPACHRFSIRGPPELAIAAVARQVRSL